MKKASAALAREPTQPVIWKLLSNTLCLSGYPAGQFAVFMAPRAAASNYLCHDHGLRRRLAHTPLRNSNLKPYHKVQNRTFSQKRGLELRENAARRDAFARNLFVLPGILPLMASNVFNYYFASYKAKYIFKWHVVCIIIV